ncbi:hypothetical protein SAMN04488021_10557 [Paracoccus aminovorans]|uniref:Uncharacterized protein n=1 Tax=Paracoccus aminovorans TaxID=34004 RepID=A0A1I2YPC1_9RHOB|nr:hypothetical protein [Paracoccus aminovorans]CQR87463.1 hypothetical protein JCM7685_2923 [Paracoccus aminovorans]SFH27340.1 hypothetical protein SAMN04488021_10557 [Paracoccus aminovorans]
MTKTLLPRLVPAVLALALAAPALAATQSREENLANPRGWSAVAGMDPREVREMARTLPLSANAGGDQPWCDRKAEIESTLRHDFDEQKVATGEEGTALWGSALMGTWTMVLERPDATSCVIASGIGFSEGANPRVFFTRAGLNG